MMGRRIALAIIFGLGLSAQAHASCVCRCVDGKMRALCSNAADIAPICPATICAIPPAAIAPIKPPRIRPPATFECEQRQVLNPDTHQYEWRRLCQ
jgi:hypothetical protein